ncbi:MAG TPA: glutamate--tRNA ligase [Candidatus Paceibacterota bacterium]|nr:glutamate--tRNA ligase [Candidatus Paceibacterota bacterium]
MTVRTRFAPSPTGFMHVGNVRSALFAWLFARKHGGQFILRIEDTDKVREVEGSIGHILESLHWLGLNWDEGPDIGGPHEPYIQSSRLPLYREYAERLIKKGFAYADSRSPEELDALRKKAEEEKRPFLAREHRPNVLEEWNGTQSLRLRVPELKRYAWHDLVRGDLSAGEDALDDFILIKSDGYPTYNFAHVVDDIEMGVTHVMRGEEYISSTPKYLSLYEALGETSPALAHLPHILGDAGTKKLGKRDGAKDILEYRAEGYLPDAMLNFLALLGWHPEEGSEVLDRESLIAAFDIEKVQRGGARFDDRKLLHINQEWMRKLSDAEYARELGEEVPSSVIAVLRERAQTFSEAKDMLRSELAYLSAAPTLDTAKLIAKEPADRPGLTKAALEALIPMIEALPAAPHADAVKESLMPFADAEEGKGKGGRGGVLWPLRYALSGAERSPDPFTLISILGPAEAASRVRTALDSI